MNLYKFSLDDFLILISKGLKNQIIPEDILRDEIKLSHLKRIDKVFNKGLHYYLDPKAPETSKEASIFFRKQNFNSDLNIGAKKIVNHFEEFKISLSAIAKLSDMEYERVFPIFSINDNPKSVAKEIREILYPVFTNNLKDFLKALISKFAEHNILVFEFVEYWNQKEKANIDGFFLNPNVIVLKRQQLSFRREIFTLIHELGHFLLNEEEIEKLEIEHLANHNLSSIERWCNDFSFYFLAGDFADTLEKIHSVGPENDYQFELIEKISKKTHLSQIALFTRLLLERKISPSNYNNVKMEFEKAFKERQAELQRIKEIEKAQGKKQRGSAPQPIKSPLLVSTIQTAFYEGILNEYEVCKRLNIKPDKLDRYIQ
ncbi:ImmA/IrrE family metallo-endopeptidase [Flagellimonas onchidii]|uniref:ImmA/IrrE family metallo-endopeptidase n=1 Tax=Flagellimonas onchidii TaxID=2562684 RepID=UPI001F0D25A9|nr:ImmA/IrrE family metallo-endopeptidase [Allomuricauda onchidii]